MVKRTVFYMLILMTSFQVYAQDVIMLNNRAKIEAKEIVIKGKIINYQEYIDSTGIQYSVALSKVEYILFQNGEKVFASDLFSNQSKTMVPAKNLITFHLLDFAINNFTLSYERILGDGKLSLQFPISFGYGDEPAKVLFPTPFGDEFNSRFANKFSAGVKFNIYPTRQGKVRYFFGPSLIFGNGDYSTDSYYAYQPKLINTGFLAFLVNNGIMITPIEHFSLALIGSIGARHFFSVESGKTLSVAQLSFNLSYRF
ncbi:MAG: hypothetical protein Q8O72_05725 [Bacteroidales bacterium]|nr:hypothetical protein [Bacteroidales bacterium]